MKEKSTDHQQLEAYHQFKMKGLFAECDAIICGRNTNYLPYIKTKEGKYSERKLNAFTAELTGYLQKEYTDRHMELNPIREQFYRNYFPVRILSQIYAVELDGKFDEDFSMNSLLSPFLEQYAFIPYPETDHMYTDADGSLNWSPSQTFFRCEFFDVLEDRYILQKTKEENEKPTFTGFPDYEDENFLPFCEDLFYSCLNMLQHNLYHAYHDEAQMFHDIRFMLNRFCDTHDLSMHTDHEAYLKAYAVMKNTIQQLSYI